METLLGPDLLRALEGGHRTKWRVELLDSKDKMIRTLTEFQGGKLEQNLYRAIRGGGNLTLLSEPGQTSFDIDWGTARFRPVMRIDDTWDIPWGIYLPSKPNEVLDEEQKTVSASVSLMDKLLVLQQDGPLDTFSLAAGTEVTDTIGYILTELVGETMVIVEESNLALPNARSYPPDASWLEIINDLCSIINYWSIFEDRQGFLRVESYTDPARRSPIYTFTHGASPYKPEWEKEQDWFDVPNRVVLRTDGGPEEEAFTAYADNINPDSIFSIPSRGRVIRHFEDGVEAADQMVLQELAWRRLESLTGAVTNLHLDIAPLPLWPNDRVNFITNTDGSTIPLTVTQLQIPLDPTGLMQARFRQLVSVS